MNLDDEMVAALQRQRDHVAASHAINRSGWTREQWIADARKQFCDLEGSVLDLVNGHVSALLSGIDELRAAGQAADREASRLDERLIQERADNRALRLGIARANKRADELETHAGGSAANYDAGIRFAIQEIRKAFQGGDS